MSDKNLFEIVDGKLVSFKGRHDVQGTIVIPAEVTCIGKGALSNSKFKHVCFLGNVTKIEEGAFTLCSKLECIEIPRGVKKIEESTFSNCGQLQSVTIPNGVESIGRGAFAGCRQLKKVCIPDGVRSIEAFAFMEDASLEKVCISQSVTKIEASAFVGTSRLSEFVVDKASSTYRSCGDNLYTRDLKTLVRVISTANEMEIPESVTAIGDYAFAAGAIEHAKIPSGVISIGGYAFNRCRNLRYMVMPESVTTVGDYCFDKCNFLESVYYFGTENEWSKIICIKTRNPALTRATVYFYSESAPEENGRWWHFENGKPAVWQNR